MKRTASILFATIVSAVCFAQQMNMEPPAELKKLSWVLGSWSGTLNWTAPDMQMSGTMTWKAEWENQFLKMTTVTEMSGMKMVETSYTGWNAKKKSYDSYTFTNFAPTPRIEHGTLTGDKFVSISEPWEVGGSPTPTVGRATLVKKSDTEATMILEFKEGEKWTKVAEGTFKKAG